MDTGSEVRELCDLYLCMDLMTLDFDTQKMSKLETCNHIRQKIIESRSKRVNPICQNDATPSYTISIDDEVKMWESSLETFRVFNAKSGKLYIPKTKRTAIVWIDTENAVRKTK